MRGRSPAARAPASGSAPRSAASRRGSRARPSPSARAHASRVTSSAVGPSPPLTITSSARASSSGDRGGDRARIVLDAPLLDEREPARREQARGQQRVGVETVACAAAPSPPPGTPHVGTSVMARIVAAARTGHRAPGQGTARDVMAVREGMNMPAGPPLSRSPEPGAGDCGRAGPGFKWRHGPRSAGCLPRRPARGRSRCRTSASTASRSAGGGKSSGSPPPSRPRRSCSPRRPTWGADAVLVHHGLLWRGDEPAARRRLVPRAACGC